VSDEFVFDVAVLGAGIAGASVAYRLSQHLRTILIERESQPGVHSTGRSAAMFMESYGPPGVRALTRASRAFYQDPPAGFTAGRVLTPRGALYLATPDQQALLEHTRAELTASGCALERLDPDEALAHVPCLRAERIHAALLDVDAQDIDVHALHQGFLRALRGQGGVLRNDKRLLGATRGLGIWEMRLADGDAILARSVVNATGAWADEVAGVFAAAPIGLTPCRRTAFTFKAPDGLDASRWPAVVSVDESYYFKPDAGQLLGSPANADPTTPHDVMPEEIDVATGIDRIELATTLSIRRPTSTWAGLRSFVRDGELVIGWDDQCPGFFWLAAQGGYGIQSAAAASELAAALLRGAEVPAELVRFGVDPQAFAPARLR